MYLPALTANGFFILPTEAADKGLKLAGAAQLKVLIAVYRNVNAPPDIAQVAALTGLSAGDAEDALRYWIDRGLIIRQEDRAPAAGTTADGTPQTADRTQPSAEPLPAEPAEEKTGEKDEAPAPPEKKHINHEIKPTTKQINSRCKEDPEIREFFRQAQQTLGRTLGYESQAPLLLCIDCLGLPPPVVLMICEYAKMNGKSGFSYIFSVAEDWAHDGVDTVEAANERIAALESAAAIWKAFAVRIGNANPAPSKKQSEYLFKWSTAFGYGLDEILLAYDEMADHTSSFSFAYMDKVLSNWNAEGLKNASQIKRYMQEKTEQRRTQADKTAPPDARKTAAGKKDRSPGRAAVSYDIAAAENAAAQGAPVYQRKKKKK